jgi:hypothetical protein
VYVLLLLFLGSWLGHFFSQLSEFRSEQAMHGQPFMWSDYWSSFIASTLENWQSEWLQLVFQAILLLCAKHWIFKAKPLRTNTSGYGRSSPALYAAARRVRGRNGVAD